MQSPPAKQYFKYSFNNGARHSRITIHCSLLFCIMSSKYLPLSQLISISSLRKAPRSIIKQSIAKHAYRANSFTLFRRPPRPAGASKQSSQTAVKSRKSALKNSRVRIFHSTRAPPHRLSTALSRAGPRVINFGILSRKQSAARRPTSRRLNPPRQQCLFARLPRNPRLAGGQCLLAHSTISFFKLARAGARKTSRQKTNGAGRISLPNIARGRTAAARTYLAFFRGRIYAREESLPIHCC